LSYKNLPLLHILHLWTKSDTEEIPSDTDEIESVDTGVGGGNNAQVLPAAHEQMWACMGGKVQQRRFMDKKSVHVKCLVTLTNT